MKRFFVICMACLLILGLWGCGEKPVETEPTLASLSAEEVKVWSAEELRKKIGSDAINGQVTDILSSDVLVVRLHTTNNVLLHVLGNTVYVFTEQADEWCVGDNVTVLFGETVIPNDRSQHPRMTAEEVRQTLFGAKPIIYLYPEEPTVCSVKVTLDGMLTCTYPAHGPDGWQDFSAYPDGTLVFPDGQEYYALYWEGTQNTQWDFSQGWCVPGAETAAFLDWALAALGLSRREANEFIVYWLPQMEENAYNVIAFQQDAYTDHAALEITPAPDSLLRVFMAYYATETPVEITPQTLQPFRRQGFTVVEWGGSKVDAP